MGGKQLVLVFVAAAMVLEGEAEGVDICEKADDVSLCRSYVKGSSDPRPAIKATIEQLLSETKRAKTSSEKLGDSDFIGVCTENYDSAIDDLQNSLLSLEKNDKASLQSSLSGVATFYVTCTDTVSEGGVHIMKMAKKLVKKDSKLQHLAGTSLYLASLLK
ncbi:uncharacterized protein LOC111487748 [Cucurbita maxima]|uniref:Uncharacterized protein LOC111487748 n=1 Tax=Cucurbita maxima TaxID=3661 RepID=A0A6J1JTP3_CUCMA|nr:uncharacterized protein LOC111487748 [Cucurbita maxima]